MEKQKQLSYQNLGASSQKEDVHDAIKNVDKGLFPTAFCKVIPDIFANDDDYCVIFHADGAGTKSIISYLYWKETGDATIFKGLSQDALVMNIDDIACTGLLNDFIVSNTIGRNKFLIDRRVLAELISGYDTFSRGLKELGIDIHLCGGETADVGDIVRTVIVDSTVAARGRRDRIIETKNIQPGDVIVGLASNGKSSYETEENSGISSNGITLARHTIIHHDYINKYPEILDPNVDESLAYAGRFKLSDMMPSGSMTVGKALLSPTRTYIPVLKALFSNFPTTDERKEHIHGIIHNTGGGQTKCMKFGNNVSYVKDALFETPEIFSLIQEEGNIEWKEMYRVFNMGHRLEIICPESSAKVIIDSAKKFNVNAKIVGHVDKNTHRNSLEIQSTHGTFSF
ncbi:MAG: AIR synthase-related protein [Promethearchaeota archaeon]